MGLLKNVIPAQAGIQKCLKSLDPRFHGDDKKYIFSFFYSATYTLKTSHVT